MCKMFKTLTEIRGKPFGVHVQTVVELQDHFDKNVPDSVLE